MRTPLLVFGVLLGLVTPSWSLPLELGVDGHWGFYVFGAVPGSAAEQAEIQPGDLLVEFDTIPFQDLRSPQELGRLMDASENLSVAIRYVRKANPEDPTFEEGTAFLTPTLRDASHPRATMGLMGTAVFLVTDVAEGTRGAYLGLKKGDYVNQVMGKGLGQATDEDWQAALAGKLSLQVFTYNPNRAPDQPLHAPLVLSEDN